MTTFRDEVQTRCAECGWWVKHSPDCPTFRDEVPSDEARSLQGRAQGHFLPGLPLDGTSSVQVEEGRAGGATPSGVPAKSAHQGGGRCSSHREPHELTEGCKEPSGATTEPRPQSHPVLLSAVEVRR